MERNPVTVYESEAPNRWQSLRGAARLAVEGTREVTRLTEQAHWQVLRTMGLAQDDPEKRTRGITGLVYRSIDGITRGVGLGLDSGLGALEPWVAGSSLGAAVDDPNFLTVRAILNGVMGDSLAASGNPLTIPMSLKPLVKNTAGPRKAVRLWGSPQRKVAVLVHGLCMGAHQWQVPENLKEKYPDYQGLGHYLGEALGYEVFLLDYNTGLSVVGNGEKLSGLLQRTLCPGGGDFKGELTLVGYSMGGLVSRSACESARLSGHSWLTGLKHLVTVGTPHQGAPLERGGHQFQQLLRSISHTAPYARLGDLRSNGITDLRHGAVICSPDPKSDTKPSVLPLPEGVHCFAIAGCLAESDTHWSRHPLGDGLVPVYSALGKHRDPDRRLDFKEKDQVLLKGVGHLGLLHAPEVAHQIKAWVAK